MAMWFRPPAADPEERASQERGPQERRPEEPRPGRSRPEARGPEECGPRGRRARFFRAAVERLRRRGAERLAAAPATERVVEGLHRAATGLAEATSEVSAYAGLLEEKTGELRARTRRLRGSADSG
ncbi:hypothetical protein [Planomonospora venezuelensis]|uniref:Uncharacterized protein n=1 Tax=Planomonospora venezuelensis TaxID=1999 RepID=A0A841CXS2_PLAVE|nr:hypothetical protein [Planomonospora venezuelensis]MBB5962210.1 hypothetical protein [Planomonospora venezuelensis]GIN00976.1 hypothetical protein Pve01_26340 [Planomonospora venezuelensis]